MRGAYSAHTDQRPQILNGMFAGAGRHDSSKATFWAVTLRTVPCGEQAAGALPVADADGLIDGIDVGLALGATLGFVMFTMPATAAGGTNAVRPAENGSPIVG